MICIFCSIHANAQKVSIASDSNIESWDNSVVNYRHPSTDTIAYYKQHPDYNYNETEKAESLLNRFLRWIAQFLMVDGHASWIGWAFLALAIFALLAIIIRLFGIPIKGLFVFSRSTKVTELSFTSGVNDIESENLEKILADFINAGAYREATRILFLISLRQLNRNKLIKWNIWKTDREYYYELKDEKLKAEFLSVIRSYEYIWYGKFTPEKERFEEVNEQFNHLTSTIKSVNN
nr:hypothetical protein [uncultured Carboxylicivirga sp.]